MKKLISVFLVLMMAAGLGLPVAASGFSASGVSGVTLSSPMEFTEEVTSSDAAAIKAVEVFLASAGNTVSVPENESGIARIEVKTGGGTAVYKLLFAGERYYLAKGSDCRTIEYAAFETLVRAIDGVYASVIKPIDKTLFYPYAPVPGASYDGQGLAIFENAYAFKRLNGKFAYRATAFDMAVPEFSSRDGKVVKPEFYLAPSTVTYSVSRDGESEPIWTWDSAKALTQKLPAGRYNVMVKANYTGDAYRGAVTYWYTLSVGESAPEPEPSAVNVAPVTFAVEAGHAAPGEMIVLRVTGPDAAKATATAVTDLDYKPTFFPDGSGGQIALAPVSVYAAPGAHSVTITSGAYSETLSYIVREKQFEVQQLTVSASTAEETILSQQANNEYETVVAPLRFIADNGRHWSGRFILPTSDEKVTSPFGIIRYVNGGSTPTRHNALDLAVPLGTPVKAAGGGRVLHAGFLQLTGNTIIIEHGYGLKSWYYHMNSLNVKTGDIVTGGQKIGEVGSTGFSTGAHMHFGMSVNNVFVNPYTLINTDLAE